MYIRRLTTRRSSSGQTYSSYRLVESRREGGRIRQIALLNLGSHFDLPEAHWPALCARLGQLLGRQGVLVPVDLPEAVEMAAQALAARLVARAPVETDTPTYAEVDVASLELVQPRSVGVEHVGLYALEQLELAPLLASLGVNGVTRAMILAQVVGRLALRGAGLAALTGRDEKMIV